MSSADSEPLGIADLAQRAGVTPRTIRFYVTEGLLPPPSGAGPHRVYTTEHLLRLQAIQRLKDVYLPLREIRRRLEGLSRFELEQFVSVPAAVSTTFLTSESPTEISPVLPRTPSTPPPLPTAAPPFLASLRPPARDLAEPRLGAAYVLGGELPSEPKLPPEGESPTDAEIEASVWRRVTLAPGVELTFQLSGDRLRDSAILRLVRIARQILERTK